MTRLLSVDGAAEVLGVHRQTVLELIWAEQLTWVNVTTGKRPRIRIEMTELERFIKSRKQMAKAA